MELYKQALDKALDQNYVNEEKWTKYKNEIGDTTECMNEFIKSCHLDIMVPIGKKAFIKGKLQHTNDILVSHSSNYFSLVSNSQANEIMKTRTETCDDQLQSFKKERKLFSDKLELPKGEEFSGQEIIEEYDEAAEAEWREKHKESIKKQKLTEADKRRNEQKIDEVNELLDRYELLEEMAGELENLSEEGISDDALLKLMNGEMKAESKKRIAHDVDETAESLDVKSTYILQKYEKNQDNVTKGPIIDSVAEDTPPEGSKKKKKERRRVTFSSTEDVKVIVPAQEVEPESTIQIKFHHLPAKFHPNPQKENISEDEPKFAHPGDFLKFVNSIKLPVETKSILKSKGAQKSKKSASFKKPENDEENEEFESYLRQQVVMGDVIEHHDEAAAKPLKEVQSNPQKVSKFKSMRAKIK